MLGARQAFFAFWRKAYQENLTGLAAMVAYNLLLSIFPVALVALFVAGRVLSSPDLEASVLRDLQELFPSATTTTLQDALRSVRESSTTVGIVALVSALWFGASFWGALDTAFCQIYALPCRSWVRQKLFGFAMLGLILIFFAATVAVPTVQSLLSANAKQLPFGLGDRQVLFAATLAASLLITFGGLATIYRAVPNCRVGWHSVWPGALGATVAIGTLDYAFPLYLNNVSSLAGVRTTVVFILILLVWFYALAIIILAGAVVNELRLEHRRTGTLAAMPDPTTEGMRLDQIEREREEHARAQQADEDTASDQHARRAERAGYLKEKLGERAVAEDEAEAEAEARKS